MDSRLRGLLFGLSLLTVLVVGALGFGAIRSPQPATWPGRVAVIGTDPQDTRQPVRFLAIADPVRRAVVVVPPDAVIEVPGSGFLRAHHAYRLGGSRLVRETLGRLFGVDVPFSVTGQGRDFSALAHGFTTAEILPESLDELRAALEEGARTWEVKEVAGEAREGEQGRLLIVSPESVSEAARAIGGLGTTVFVDPTRTGLVEATDPLPAPEVSPTAAPAPAIPRSQIGVDVLNGGRTEGAAVQAAERLRALDYPVLRVADFNPRNRERSVVYFKPGTEDKARVVAADLGLPAAPAPQGITIRDSADVLVLLGHDARLEEADAQTAGE